MNVTVGEKTRWLIYAPGAVMRDVRLPPTPIRRMGEIFDGLHTFLSREVL